MAYSAMAVANAFIRRASEQRLSNLTPMKLQKLLYFAQSWHLALNHAPLIDESFHRWQYGPVIPSLYHDFKEYGANPIVNYGGHFIVQNGQFVKAYPIVQDNDPAWNFIDKIIDVYGNFSGPQLSELTHQSNSAWAKSGPPDGGVIPNEMMAETVSPSNN